MRDQSENRGGAILRSRMGGCETVGAEVGITRGRMGASGSRKGWTKAIHRRSVSVGEGVDPLGGKGRHKRKVSQRKASPGPDRHAMMVAEPGEEDLRRVHHQNEPDAGCLARKSRAMVDIR